MVTVNVGLLFLYAKMFTENVCCLLINFYRRLKN